MLRTSDKLKFVGHRFLFPCIRSRFRWIVRFLFVVVEPAAQILLNLDGLLGAGIQKLLQTHNTSAHHSGLLFSPLLKLIFGLYVVWFRDVVKQDQPAHNHQRDDPNSNPVVRTQSLHRLAGALVRRSPLVADKSAF